MRNRKWILDVLAGITIIGIAIVLVAVAKADGPSGPPAPLDEWKYIIGWDAEGSYITVVTALYADGTLADGWSSRNVIGSPAAFQQFPLKPEPDPNTCPEDVNGDGIVNLLDLNKVLEAFGQECE